jgi:hypothetical protein
MTKSRKSTLEKMTQLFTRLESVNECNNYGGLLAQEIQQSEALFQSVPSLKKGVYRRPTPMIAARFRFAGAWVNAGLGHTWLSVSGMEDVWSDKTILKQIRIRQEYWQKSAPALFSWSRVSLFGIERNEQEETYLVWNDGRKKEAEVYVYIGHEEKIFKNLRVYVEYLLT